MNQGSLPLLFCITSHLQNGKIVYAGVFSISLKKIHAYNINSAVVYLEYTHLECTENTIEKTNERAPNSLFIFF